MRSLATKLACKYTEIQDDKALVCASFLLLSFS